MRGAHHYAFEDSLAADEGLLTALQSRQELDRRQETHHLLPMSHSHLMFH
jgi:hypothetical protein